MSLSCDGHDEAQRRWVRRRVAAFAPVSAFPPKSQSNASSREQSGCLQLASHLAELELDGVERGDRLAKGLTLHGVFCGQVERRLDREEGEEERGKKNRCGKPELEGFGAEVAWQQNEVSC